MMKLANLQPVALAFLASCALHLALLTQPSYVIVGNAEMGSNRPKPPAMELHLVNEALVENSVNSGQRIFQPIQQGIATASPIQTPGTSAFETPRQPGLQDVPLLPITADHYYRSEQLTVKPVVLYEQDLDSVQTRGMAANGKIQLFVFINEAGKVTSVEIEKSALPEIFTSAVRDAFLQFVFTPGQRDGQAVKSVLHIEAAYSDNF